MIVILFTNEIICRTIYIYERYLSTGTDRRQTLPDAKNIIRIDTRAGLMTLGTQLMFSVMLLQFITSKNSLHPLPALVTIGYARKYIRVILLGFRQSRFSYGLQLQYGLHHNTPLTPPSPSALAISFMQLNRNSIFSEQECPPPKDTPIILAPHFPR